MAHLSDSDKKAFKELTARGWVQSETERSPATVQPTLEDRERYCRWASEASKFFKGDKPVNFGGDNWKL